MNTTTTPSLPSLLRFAAGVSRVGIRHGSSVPRYKKPQPENAGFWPGHGENIWVFNHLMTNQIIYSTKSTITSRQLNQLPFNGKKTKPAKLRKDYWRPMAKISLPEGKGDVGRSVFQRLREFKRRHELEWGYQANDFLHMTKKERGAALNNQKANAIADMAAVLGGAGKGNLVRADSEKANLVPAVVYWHNKYDATFAKAWPENVKHRLADGELMYEEEEEVLSGEQVLEQGEQLLIEGEQLAKEGRELLLAEGIEAPVPEALRGLR